MSYTDMVASLGSAAVRHSRPSPGFPSRSSRRSPATPWAAGASSRSARDFRVAADDAKLGQPEILLGIIPGAGGTQRLARLVGPAKAKDLIFTGRFVGADEALRIGLVDKVVPAADVYAEAHRLGRAVRQRPAVRAAGGQGGHRPRARDSTSTPGWRSSGSSFAALFATEDRTTGMRSFVENGPGKATFEGR